MKKSKGTKSKINVGQELRNLGALLEKNNHEIGVIAEQYGSINEKLDSHTEILKSHTEMIGQNAETISKVAIDVGIIKTDIGFIKGGLKKKVDYDEFLALERRLSAVESKMK